MRTAIKHCLFSGIVLAVSICLASWPAISMAANHAYDIGWLDGDTNPVLDPAGPAYYPTLAYDDAEFAGHGPAYPYKMWYSNGSQVGLAYSDDGETWLDQGLLADLTTAHHPWVVYDAGGFGGSGIYYKLWYWDTTKVYGPAKSIAYAESTDGVNWTNKQNVFGGTGVSGDWNRGSYGPATVLYSSSAANTGPDPMDYSYVMYYDGTNGSFEELGLASSTDGINWAAFGATPVLPRGGGSWGTTDTWDSSYAYPATVLKANGKYRMWYSGGQTANSQGIGYAESTDGVSWNKSAANPMTALGGFGLFNAFGPPGSWNAQRNYTPAVLYDPAQFNGHGRSYYFKMWRSGRSGAGNVAIGAAFLPEAPDPPTPATGWNINVVLMLSALLVSSGVFLMRRRNSLWIVQESNL